MKAGLQQLVAEVSALRSSVAELQNNQVSPFAAGTGAIGPMDLNSINQGFKPLQLNGQLYINGQTVPGATVNFDPKKRGPVGRLKVDVAPPKSELEKIKKEAKAALNKYEQKLQNRGKPKKEEKVDFSKPRGPVGKLKLAMDLPSPKLLLQKLTNTTSTSTPAPAPAPAKPATVAHIPKHRGPVGRLKVSPALVAPVPLLTVDKVVLPQASTTPLPPRKEMVLDLSKPRGPVGKLKVVAPVPLAGPVTIQPLPGAPTTAPMPQLPTPSKPVDLSKPRGPVGKLKERIAPTPAKPAAAAAPPTASAPAASTPAIKAIRRRVRKGDRGPVGRLQAQQQPIGAIVGAGGVPGATDPVLLKAQALAKSMFDQWVKQHQANVDTQNKLALLAAKY